MAFDRTFQALQEWKRRRQQSGKLHPLAFLKAIAPAAKMMTRAVNYLLPIAAMVVLTLTVQHFGTLRYGLRVEYNGEHIGYILSESAFTEAEAKVRERIVNEAYLPPGRQRADLFFGSCSGRPDLRRGHPHQQHHPRFRQRDCRGRRPVCR